MAVIQEAWIGCESPRRVDDLVQAIGLSKNVNSTMSRLCKAIDVRVNAFLKHPLVGKWPYLWLDATYLKQREAGRSDGSGDNRRDGKYRGQAGDRGLPIGPSEAESFWSTLLKSLVKRGLCGTKLVISDARTTA